MASQTDNRAISETKPLDEFQQKLLNLPKPVQDWVCSLAAAENNSQIAEKFNLTSDKNPVLARLTSDTILKNMSLDALPSLLQENLKVDPRTAQQIAVEIAIKQFLIIKEHLKDTEHFILKLGGAIPAKIPDISSVTTFAPPAPAPVQQTIKKPFRQAVHENKEVLNQQLTAQPIKIPDFDQPARPTIKNWLSDYIKQKGTGHHDELERGDYLYKSLNAQNLPAEDRLKLAAILKAYDEDTEMPISPETNLILIEDLLKKETPLKTSAPAAPPSPQSSAGNLEGQTAPAVSPPQGQPVASARLEWSPSPSPAKQKTYSPPPPPAAAPAPPTPAPLPSFIPPAPKPAPPPPDYSRFAPPGGSDTYREPIEEDDLTGPLKPPPRPAPRLDGNIVDLKNLNE